MRIVMVSPCYYPVKGGTETIVRGLVIALNKNGIHTDVVTFNVDQRRNPTWKGKVEVIDEVMVFRIPALKLTSSYNVTAGVNFIPGRFINILRNYDIIHFHEFELSFPLFSYIVRKPKILHLHGVDFDFLRRHFISKFLFKHLVHFYISISKQMMDNLITLGVPKDRITYVPNGIDTTTFIPVKKREDDMLLYVGRISPGKGLHVLVKSLQYLEKSVKLIIIGPPGWDLNYYQNLMSVIKKENLKGKHKIMYLGAMEQNELVKWYQAATLFILPSSFEGSPVTILEALACETPVITTSVGGIPEIIKNHQTGILVPQNDCKSLAKAIQYLLENKDIRLKMGREGRKHVVKEYSLETTSKKLIAIYNQLLNN